MQSQLVHVRGCQLLFVPCDSKLLVDTGMLSVVRGCKCSVTSTMSADFKPPQGELLQSCTAEPPGGLAPGGDFRKPAWTRGCAFARGGVGFVPASPVPVEREREREGVGATLEPGTLAKKGVVSCCFWLARGLGNGWRTIPQHGVGMHRHEPSGQALAVAVAPYRWQASTRHRVQQPCCRKRGSC